MRTVIAVHIPSELALREASRWNTRLVLVRTLVFIALICQWISGNGSIIPATGEYRHEEVDYESRTPHELVVRRIYHSSPGFKASKAPDVLGFVGFGMAARLNSDSVGHVYVISNNDMSYQVFTGKQSEYQGERRGTYGPRGEYIPVPDKRPVGSVTFVSKWTSVGNGDTLTSTPVDPSDAYSAVASWTYHRDADGSTWVFSGSGQLQTVTDHHGWVMRYSYDDKGLISRISNHFGRSLSFAYVEGELPAAMASAASKAEPDAKPYDQRRAKISAITLPNGQAMTYDYDAATGMLTAVHYPDGSFKRYVYADPRFPKALTQVIDETQRVYVDIAYDGEGRPVSAGYGNGINLYRVAYGPNRSSAVITDPLGVERAYGYSFKGGRLAVTRADKPGPIGDKGVSAASRVQDEQGNLVTETDFAGNQTLFAWDPARRLEQTRTTAANSPQAVTTRTQWHPSMAMPVVVSEQDSQITSVYNGQPDPFNEGAVASCAPPSAVLPDGSPVVVLCKRVWQTISGPRGQAGAGAGRERQTSPRTWLWTYDANGQVLSATDPLNNTSTRRYYDDTTAQHTQGDLQSETDTQGRTYQFTEYDGHGNVLKYTDPNGVVAVNSYDERQRLIAYNMGGKLTRFGYTATGLLDKVTRPDRSSISYHYDVAHRLTGISDSLGNRVTYRLDNAGNRTGETFSDRKGALRKQLGWALGAYHSLGANKPQE